MMRLSHYRQAPFVVLFSLLVAGAASANTAKFTFIKASETGIGPAETYPYALYLNNSRMPACLLCASYYNTITSGESRMSVAWFPQNIGNNLPGPSMILRKQVAYTQNWDGIIQADIMFRTVPEPSSLILIGTGLIVLAGTIRWKFVKSRPSK
jgi:hypothetical protein